MLVKSLKLTAICILFLVVPLLAHHSHGNYDTTKWTTMEGKVTEVHYLVPHSWLYVEVKDDKSEPTVWAMEATGFGGLFRVGVKREDLKAGDTVKVRCHLLKDGSNGCLLGYVTPLHGDQVRGQGIEKDWDGGGGAGFPDSQPGAAPGNR
ncbi:MAG: hypothetical protein DMG19_02115 [Acidobacteria bacterium]|nr:MAG: hypothetical protein DMG19_02115 [Acidobacteriota bacterium]